MKLKLILLLTLGVSLSALSQVPTYYNDVNINLTGTALKTELATKIINTHTTNLSYTPGVWDAIKQTDLDPNDNTKVLLLYGYNDSDANYVTDRTRSKDVNGGNAGTQWNREHTFPKSLGDPNLQTSGPGADAHHLRATDITMNSNRGSLQFIDGSGNAGTVGSGWYPGDEWKGDVARMMMYMYLRYDDRCYPSVVTIGTANSSDANMIDLLLEWNAEDPVSDYELQRNTVLEGLQGNRNPFIDNPAFATTIWGGPQAENRFNSISDCSELFISEYIEGTGNNKYLEIYNPTGSSIDLSSYDVVMYQNGSSSITYTLALSGTIASGGTFVIENTNEALSVSADLQDNTVMTFNGDDTIALRKSGTTIDVIGQIGTDPGNQWSGTTCTLGTEDATLRRNYDVKVGDSDGSNTFDPDTEWTCATIDVSNLGTHTNVCLTNEIDVQGNNNSIADGSTTTSTTNDTDFGSITTSSGSITKTFTILNQGNQTLTLSGNPVISGTNAADFTLTTSPTLVINGLSSTTFSITFNPSADGTRTATITINSDDSDEGVYTYNIEGTGTADGGDTYCGAESFTNSNAPSGSYGDGSFTGDNSVTWTYVGSRDDESYEITGTGLMLRNTSSKLTSSTISGGIGDFYMKLKKGFTGSGNRQVQLYINNVLAGTSVSWDNTTTQDFYVTGINVSGDIVIEIRNTTSKQVVLDDISWTCYEESEIDIQGNSISIPDGTTATSTDNDTDFGTINTTSGSITKRFTILNTGGQDLTITGDPLVTISGTNSDDFSLTSVPNSTIASSGSTTFDITFNPSADGDRVATITINSNDTDEAVYNFNIKGSGTSNSQSCASVSQTIFQQDFEASPATPTLTYTSSNTTTSSGTGTFPTGENMFANGTQGIQSSGTGHITFNSVDVSSYSNIGFTFKLAAFSTSSGNGLDLADYIKVWVSTDGGSTESEEMIITGSSNSNGWWSFNTGTSTASSTYTGSNPQNTFTPTGSGDSTVDKYGTVTLSGLPNSNNLRIRLEIKRNNSAEIWVIDDAKITADGESTTTWNGTTWSNGTPNATTKAILDGNYNMATNPSINSCECQINNGSTLTVSSEKFITIEGNLINNGSLVVESDGSLVQVSSSATVTGSGLYSIRRQSTSLPSKNVFTYWSSPLTNSTLDQVVSGAGKYYSFTAGTQSWKSENSSSTMTPGIGYITQGDPAISYPSSYTAYFSGSALNTGDITVPITYNDDGNADNDWNLIGNPYASALNADALLAANTSSLGGTLYLWTHNTDASSSSNFSQNDYVSWNGTGGVANCGGCKAPTKFLASGQGFFVQGLTSTNITITNEMRVSGENKNFYRQETKTQDKIWLNLFNEESFSQTLIGFIEQATDSIDQKYDGLRLDSGANASFYSVINDKPYAIQGKSNLKETEEIPLGVNLKIIGDFTIKIEKIEGKLEQSNIYLVDKLLNKAHDLKASSYTFNIEETGKHDNRFVLKTTTSENVLNIEGIKNTTNFIVKSSKNQIDIRTSNNKLIKDVVIYDLLGRRILESKNNNSSRVVLISNTNLNSKILILKILLDSGEIITKKISKS